MDRHTVYRLTLGWVLLWSVLPWAGVDPALGEVHRVRALRVSEPPKIDGRLEEPVWQEAEAAKGFTQRDPVEGAPASERTWVRVLYDQRKIYFGFMCFDSQPEKIVANEMRRDSNLDENDSVEILMDTYNDRRGGFFFRVNPLGAREDKLVGDEGRSTHGDWNCLWEAEACIVEQGWQAEIAIPFSQLRFRNEGNMVWGVNFGRNIRRNNEDAHWVPVSRSLGFSARYHTAHLGELVGLEGIRPRLHLEVKPYVLPGASADLSEMPAIRETVFDVGLDVKYGITPNLTADLTFNTDFAQVEADQEEVNLTRFSLFFPEKRDFFLEGVELFQFGTGGGGWRGPPPVLLFYSRRIGLEEEEDIPILFGAKLTGKLGAYSVGVLDVLTDKESYLDEDDALQTAPRTNFSVVRLRRDVLARSSVGLMAVNKQTALDSVYNRGLGADVRLSLLDNLHVGGFVAKTWSPEEQGRDWTGYMKVDWGGDLFRGELSVLDVGEHFNAEMGYTQREDIRKVVSEVRVMPRPGIPWIRQMYIGPQWTYTEDHRGVVQSRSVEFNVWSRLEAGGWAGINVERDYEWLDEDFEIRDEVFIPIGSYTVTTVRLMVSPESSRGIGGRMSLDGGGFYDGSRKGISLSGEWKPNPRFTLEGRYNHNRIDLDRVRREDRWTTYSFSTNVLSTRLSYSFSTDLFARAFIQWNDDEERISNNFLLNYRYRPGSDIYLVYNQSWDTSGGRVKTDNWTVLGKVTYLWNW